LAEQIGTNSDLRRSLGVIGPLECIAASAGIQSPRRLYPSGGKIDRREANEIL